MATSSSSCDTATISLMRKVPNELLSEVLRHLPGQALKVARLTCTRWAAAGAPWLFTRIYFRPHIATMELFKAIINNPVFARGVTELIYDMRTFWIQMQSPDTYFKAYDEFFGNAVNNEYSVGEGEISRNRIDQESRSQYIQLYHEQQQIVNDRLDYDILSLGLQQLPNLKRLTVLNHFNPRDDDTCDYHDCAWYGDWSRKFWTHVVPPGGDWEYKDSEERPGLGFQNLLEALSLHGPPLARIDYGCAFTKMSLWQLTVNGVAAQLWNLAPSLTCFQIHCQFDMTTAWEEPEWNILWSALAGIIKHARNLERISFDMLRTGDGLKDVLLSKPLPHLTVLHLLNLSLEPETLKSICYGYKDTLHKLRIEGIALGPPITATVWKNLGKELGSYLRLRYLRLWCLGHVTALNQYPTPWSLFLDQTDIIQVGFHVMQWIPNSMLASSQRNYVTLWHRTEHTTSQFDRCR